MEGSILTMVSGSEAEIFSYPIALFSDLNVLVLIAVGLPIGFWILHKVIGLVRGGK
jgi:hypothetical protein